MKQKTKKTLKKTGLVAAAVAALAGLNFVRKYRGYKIKTSFFRKVQLDDGTEVSEWAWEATPGWIAYALSNRAAERGSAQGPTGAQMAAKEWVDWYIDVHGGGNL